MADINQTAADLLAVLEGGLIKEDLFANTFDVSDVMLEFTNRAGFTGSHKAPYFDWTMDRLQDQNLDNAFVDGADIDQQDAVEGQRVTNHSQTSLKEVKVSTRADSVDAVDRANTISRQIERRTKELRRDIEGMALKNQAAVADNGDNIAGRAGGLEAWIDGKRLVPTETGAAAATGVQTNALQQVNGAGTITGGGWDNRVSPGKILPAWDYDASVTTGAITETAIKNVMTALFQNTGERSNRVLMTRPVLHQVISDFYLSGGANVATLTAETKQQGPAQAMTAVNTILTSFGLLDMIPNNLQPAGALAADLTASAIDSDTAFILDMSQVGLSFLRGYRTEPLAKLGLSTRMMINVDWSLRVNNSEALGMIQGIDGSGATAMTA